jgi:hypothetical protein
MGKREVGKGGVLGRGVGGKEVYRKVYTIV